MFLVLYKGLFCPKNKNAFYQSFTLMLRVTAF